VGTYLRLVYIPCHIYAPVACYGILALAMMLDRYHTQRREVKAGVRFFSSN